MSKRRFTPDLPPVWLAGHMAIAWALARWLPLWRFDAGPVGRLIIVLGVAIILWSAWWFWRKRTPIEPRHTPKALIVEGPYRLNRNPIYTGLVIILAGWALGLGAISALLTVPILPLVLTRRFIAPEEAALRAVFGAEAERYLARSRRW